MCCFVYTEYCSEACWDPECRGKREMQDDGHDNYGPGSRAADSVNEGIQGVKERLPSGSARHADGQRVRDDASDLYDQVWSHASGGHIR